MADTLAISTGDILSRMLRRLPPSLWDTDPSADTLQRDLFAAIASQTAVWLEQRDIARTMTLMLQAEGIDLDVLLQDYGLKRYLQLPDPYARQVGMRILWTPQGTGYSVARLADLLLYNQPHVTMRTGRNEQHVFVASAQSVTTPYGYWGLVSDEGLWYAVTVDGEVPVCSLAPPCGVDLSPGPHTLRWFTVLDENAAPWYVTVAADTLTVSQTPPQGYGTADPFYVLDGHGNRWGLSVDSRSEALVTTVSPGLTTFGYWRVRDRAGTVYDLWIEGEVPTIATAPPGGSTDQTPGGSPLDWLSVADETGTSWFLTLQDDTLFPQRTSPGGTGTTADPQFLDAGSRLWSLSVDSRAEAVVSTLLRAVTSDYLVLDPGHAYQALRLVDSSGVPWWLSISGGAQRLTATQPVGAADVTPSGGPYRWLRVYDLAAMLWYAYPNTSGTLVVSTTNPGGLGTAQPQTLGDSAGVLWHYGVSGGAFAVSSTPPVDYGGMATAVCLNDPTGARWFWRVHEGALQWSAQLWPDTMDQSPWGELGWLQLLNDVSATVYVSPGVAGMPLVTLAPPANSPWGWSQPVTLRDVEGTAWHLTVSTRPQTVEYWRLHDATGTVVYLSIDAEVPLLAATPPGGGTDQTPGGQPLDWLTIYDEGGGVWYSAVEGDTLTMTHTLPPGTGTQVPVSLWGTTGIFWQIQGSSLTEALVTVALPSPNVVGVVQDAAPTLPLPIPTLPLRDAVDAISHIQAAGSLVTVRVS